MMRLVCVIFAFVGGGSPERPISPAEIRMTPMSA